MLIPEPIKPIILKLTLAGAVLLVLWPQSGSALMEVTPRLSTGATYTDNVRLVPENTESDIITTVTPGIQLDLSGRPAGLSLSYDPSFVSYADNTYEDYWHHLASGSAWWQPTRRTRLELRDTFIQSEDPISEDDLTLRRTRNPYTRNSATGRVTHRFGADNQFYADGRHTFLENEDPAVEDSRQYGGGGGVTYWFNVRWGVDVGADVDQATYDRSDDLLRLTGWARLNRRFNSQLTGFLQYRGVPHRFDDEARDFTVHDGSAGFDYAIDPTTDLSMSVHYLLRDVNEGQNTSATPVSIDFSRRFQRGSISLSGAGGYDYTTVSAENLGSYLYYQAGLGGSYQFTRRISGDVNGLYAYRDYEDTLPRRKDDILRAGCGLSFQLLRWLSLRAGYLYRQVDSTIDANDYRENRASLQITVQPERPYRVGE